MKVWVMRNFAIKEAALFVYSCSFVNPLPQSPSVRLKLYSMKPSVELRLDPLVLSELSFERRTQFMAGFSELLSTKDFLPRVFELELESSGALGLTLKREETDPIDAVLASKYAFSSPTIEQIVSEFNVALAESGIWVKGFKPGCAVGAEAFAGASHAAGASPGAAMTVSPLSP